MDAAGFLIYEKVNKNTIQMPKPTSYIPSN
jgi:hypothetical protein